MSNPKVTSEYGADSSFNLSDSGEVEKEIPLYSSVQLSGIVSNVQTSRTESGNNVPVPIYDSKRSANVTKREHSNSSTYATGQEHDKHNILPNNASPFIYDRNLVRYNKERGINYNAPLLIGSRTLTGTKEEKGYNPSHLVFDPNTGSLAAGYDVNNNWEHLSNFSTILGIGNSSELDASLITGSHNSIKSLKQDHDEYCVIPPACSIVGGSNNTIANNSSSQKTSAIIASRDVTVTNCETTVVLGIKGSKEEGPFEGFNEALITRNLHALGSINAGPITNESIPNGTVLVTNGNALVNGTINAQEINVKYLRADSSYIAKTDLYLEGLNGSTGMTAVINPSDSYDIVYVNPIAGTVNIYLGTGDNNMFTPNREITFKDVTLEFGSASSYNVNIIVPDATGEQQTRIEYFNGGLIAGTNAGYALNSSGGSVTFVFSRLSIPGSLPTWTIKNQFIGNPRILGTSGIKFVASSNKTKTRIITLNK